MTWATARAALIGLLEQDGHHVFRVIPESTQRNEFVALVPPARNPVREFGGLYEVQYFQRIRVMGALRSGNEDTVATNVDDRAERIMRLLNAHVKLTGPATFTTPVSFDEAAVIEYPPGTGKRYVVMTGDVTIGLVYNAEVGV